MILILCFSSILFFDLPKTIAADPQESIFPEFSGSAESLDGIAPEAALLRLGASYDPLTVGCLALGAKPWLDLIDKSSYSLKLSLPVTRGYDFYGWHEDGGNFPSAGLMASVRLKSLPARYGSWTLSTGLFLIRRDQSPSDQPARLGDFEYTGGIGTVNISIIY